MDTEETIKRSDADTGESDQCCQPGLYDEFIFGREIFQVIHDTHGEQHGDRKEKTDLRYGSTEWEPEKECCHHPCDDRDTTHSWDGRRMFLTGIGHIIQLILFYKIDDRRNSDQRNDKCADKT